MFVLTEMVAVLIMCYTPRCPQGLLQVVFLLLVISDEASRRWHIVRNERWTGNWYPEVKQTWSRGKRSRTALPFIRGRYIKKEYLQMQRNMILESCSLDCFYPSMFPTIVQFVMKFVWEQGALYQLGYQLDDRNICHRFHARSAIPNPFRNKEWHCNRIIYILPHFDGDASNFGRLRGPEQSILGWTAES